MGNLLDDRALGGSRALAVEGDDVASASLDFLPGVAVGPAIGEGLGVGVRQGDDRQAELLIEGEGLLDLVEFSVEEVEEGVVGGGHLVASRGSALACLAFTLTLTLSLKGEGTSLPNLRPHPSPRVRHGAGSPSRERGQEGRGDRKGEGIRGGSEEVLFGLAEDGVSLFEEGGHSFLSLRTAGGVADFSGFPLHLGFEAFVPRVVVEALGCSD